jgi:periplasmic divalent cation tolerance protein
MVESGLADRQPAAYRTLYITAAGLDEARSIADVLVTERLAACANIVPAVESIYHWQGEIVRDREAIVFAKTCADRVDAAIARVKSVHSYSVPCVVALPILAGNADYLAWLRAETRVAAP